MLTATELDAMDVGQIVLDREGREWTRTSYGSWRGAGVLVAADVVKLYSPIRRKESHVEQPMPTASTGPSMHVLAVQEITDRMDIGLARYGQPLQAMNGRDAVRDTIEELADGLAYALQIREERRLLRAELEFLARNGATRYNLRDILTRYFPEETS